ncbi:MAG TPA: GNAT family N-acetyltransferase [Lichenihabitans sp.]|jgi:putative acetyltransferase|nr:GNAT family N-acetyltransferase [Lichenihabitans sp.]
MIANQNFKAALRPYLPADAPMLAAIFRASIEDLTGEDYDEDQRNAWAAAGADEQAFGRKLADLLTLVATIDGAPCGFAALKSNDRIEMLYVYPAVAGQGIGTLLVDALEKLGQARGAKSVSVDASDTARALFERRGYKAQSRNSVPLSGEWLANTTLEKRFDAATKP